MEEEILRARDSKFISYLLLKLLHSRHDIIEQKEDYQKIKNNSRE